MQDLFDLCNVCNIYSIYARYFQFVQITGDTMEKRCFLFKTLLSVSIRGVPNNL